ncbi:hypothetical protein ABW21_db0207784 [Orbilia brochopaga]|nr:hypothetical protein ABW21_db0207784 [Drechslerella brochopaga]
MNQDGRTLIPPNGTKSPPLSIQLSSSMTTVTLSPPKFRRPSKKPPSKKIPSPKTRAVRQATIEYNTRAADFDTIQRTVQDLAFQAGLELQTAIHHPGYATKRASGALVSTIAKSTEIGGSLAAAGEGGRKGLEQLCEHVSKRARRVVRRASMALSGEQQQTGGIGGSGLDESYEEILNDDDDPEDVYGFIDWPDEPAKVDPAVAARWHRFK